jgi:hypothetical protein
MHYKRGLYIARPSSVFYPDIIVIESFSAVSRSNGLATAQALNGLPTLGVNFLLVKKLARSILRRTQHGHVG